MKQILVLIFFLGFSLTSLGAISPTQELIQAVEDGNLEQIEHLVSVGADVNEISQEGMTPLLMAVIRDKIDALSLLLKLGADPTIAATGKINPIALAQKNNRPLMEIYLVDKMIKQQGSGHNYLTMAAVQNNILAIKNCINLKMDLNVGDKDFGTALMYAAYYNNIEIVKLLIAAKANINATDKEGISALAIAAAQGNIKIVSLLVSAGADINQVNNKGETPLIFAAKQKQLKTVEFLIKSGANIGAKTTTGKSFLDF